MNEIKSSLFFLAGILLTFQTSCTPPEPPPPEDGVFVDGSTVNEGVELSAGLHDDPFSKPTEEADISQQESAGELTEALPIQKKRSYVVKAYRLNTRNGPGLTHKIVGSLSKGTRIETSGQSDNGWIEISNGIFCSIKFLKAIPHEDSGKNNE